MRAKKKAGAVFVDLTAAYDTAWHRGLTCKLLRLLPDKHMIKTIMELVRNQSFTLTTGDSKQSRLRCLKNGVPQGSVSASLLFNIYTYDLPYKCTLSAYLQTCRLKLSHTETVTAVFHLNNRELKVYNNGRLLPFCPNPTYLGVKLDRSYGLLSGSLDTCHVKLRSRRPFVPTGRNRLDNLARLDIRASKWTNHKWKTEYCESDSRIRAFVLGTGARPDGMGLPRAAWVKLNRLRTGVGRFHSSMHKWGLVSSPNCECGTSEQTADHVLTACLIHRTPHGARGLTILDDETRCWFNNTTASI